MADTVRFLFGNDTYRSSQKLAALTTRYIDKSLGDTNLARLDGASLTIEEWSRQVQALPFLAASRLVVVSNLLLEGKKEIQDRILEILERIPSTTVVVFYEAGLPDQRIKLFKRLNRPKLAEQFLPLAGAPRRRWISDVLAGTPTEPALIGWLAAQPVDSWRLAQTLEQLRLYAASSSRPLAVADAELFLAAEQPSDTFQLIEAVARGDSQRALTELHLLLEAGQAEFYLLAMIAYQYRILIQLAEAQQEAGSRSAGVIARQLKLSPYVVDKGLRTIGEKPINSFLAGLLTVLDYDRQMKTGLVDPRTGVELLVIELAAAAGDKTGQSQS